MSVFTSIINSPLLSLIGMFVPQAAPILEIIQRAAPIITAAEPVVQAAILEGKPAFEAAVAAAPKLAATVKELLAHLPASVAALGTDINMENITRGLVGFHPMTPEEEKVWMDRATPGNDPSQENSKYTVG